MNFQIYTFLFIIVLGLSYSKQTRSSYLTEIQRQSIHTAANNQISLTSAKDPYIIVIDPGHGGADRGCSATALAEKTLVLQFAKLLGDRIQEVNENLIVYFTRTSDISIKLLERSRLANHLNADLFVSIHTNAINDTSVHGFETYVYGLDHDGTDHHGCLHNHLTSEYILDASLDENMGDMILGNLVHSNTTTQSIVLGNKISQQLDKLSLVRNRGLKQAPFQVLKHARMPSVLLELGYLTNEGDKQFLNSKIGQEQLASKIADGLLEYLYLTN